jgi:hypothetical protein
MSKGSYVLRSPQANPVTHLFLPGYASDREVVASQIKPLSIRFAAVLGFKSVQMDIRPQGRILEK